MNSSTEYVQTQIVTFKNGKKQIQGMEYNRINQNGEPVVIKGDRWINKKHKRFSWMNPKYRTTKRKIMSLKLVPSRGMPIFIGKKSKRKSKKNKGQLIT
jgi:hypothetical protein